MIDKLIVGHITFTLNLRVSFCHISLGSIRGSKYLEQSLFNYQNYIVVCSFFLNTKRFTLKCRSRIFTIYMKFEVLTSWPSIQLSQIALLIHYHYARQHSSLYVIRSNTSTQALSLRIFGVKIWNFVDTVHKTVPSFSILRSKLKYFIVTHPDNLHDFIR